MPKFDNNIMEFPTMLHWKIYMTALRYTPPEMSLAEIEKTDPELSDSGRQGFGFMTELLYDMYKDPARYGMHPGAYEQYLNGRRFFDAKRENTTEAMIIFDQAEAELNSYLNVIDGIARCGHSENQKWMLSEEDFAGLIDSSSVPVRQKKNLIPVETVLSMLSQNGLDLIHNVDGTITVACKKYPNMFRAMSELSKSCGESINNPQSSAMKYYYAFNERYLEFRQILGNYKPNFEDYIHLMPDAQQEQMKEIRAIAKSYKMREVYLRPFMINYLYKSKPVMRVWTDYWREPRGKQNMWRRNFMIVVYGSFDETYMQGVADCGDEFIRYFMQHLNYCNCCTPEHVKQPWFSTVFGRKVRICGQPGGVFNNPTSDDMPFIKKYIDLGLKKILTETSNK